MHIKSHNSGNGFWNDYGKLWSKLKYESYPGL